MVQNNKPSALIMIFGATGDLAKRKLFPSIYRLFQKEKIDKFAVVGVARRHLTNEEFQANVKDSILTFTNEQENIDEFASHFFYHSHDVTSSESYIQLKEIADRLDSHYQLEGNRVFYLAMAPEFFGTIAEQVREQGLTDTPGYKRLVIEKPFGHSFESALELNKRIRTAFEEDEIYRIDHYLGKEMVQNIEVIRFANALFEPLWNSRYISNIQVTSSETLGVEERGRYYETSGALRDMVQNHMLQMVALLAMEPPIRLTTEEIRSEKVRALRSLRSMTAEEVNQYFVRGQYGSGTMNGQNVPGYREEQMVDSESNTETFVAGKLMIDNFRWAGVPFYIRTGKRMDIKSTKIVVQFKDIPMNLYYKTGETLHPNLLVIHIQPEEGITLLLNARKTGNGMRSRPVQLSYSNKSSDKLNTPEAYEKLLFDSMRGDATNFTHWDEVALSWKFVDRISEVWETTKDSTFPNYKSGTTGPDCADELLKKDEHFWWPVENLDLEE
ncbi:glucose-6-phosphate dehydrogenase [Bacillus sp. CECT 9360]|uniref:glucose-6-phosphate dehydrogenase n=1 Tax=Bacillus sp. CECT 9360 TaxID=2845821 RepID=UPI001E348073|nr:glucose-6-phosphate dehydrogenase [Bacillus sp. CECT 9360]CAH0345643.1 Glucose-6-phosphate 1-dehydrogenase [Bacillus sp. CECT 9360]